MPALIGIGGGTGAGKSTLAHALAARLPDQVSLIEFDWYYHTQQHLAPPDRAQVNYDHPDALDIARLLEDLDALSAGTSILAPGYDFCTHTRTEGAHSVTARPLLILEGIHALVDARLRARMALKVYVTCPPNLRLSRRIQRDTAERGRELDAVLRQYEHHVEPMHSRYVEQSRVHADLEVSGLENPEVSVERILGHLARLASGPWEGR